GHRSEASLAVAGVQEVGLDSVLHLEKLGLGGVHAGEPAIGGDEQIELAAIARVGEDAADAGRLALEPGGRGDVLELAAAEVLEEGAGLRLIGGDEEGGE